MQRPSRALGRTRRALARVRVFQRLQFWLERQFIRGASFQLLTVAALIGLISLAGGALLLPAAAESEGLAETVWWAFLRLTDPGYLGDDQGVWRRILSTWLTVSGYVVFLGALVAIMTQWLTAKMRQLESGLTPVATRNHLVVLGWTNRTLPVVAEILQSSGRVERFLADRHASRLRLVILCEEVTPWHAQVLHDDPAIGRRSRHIVLRSGTPLVMDDLQRVDCGNAAAVIVPSGAPGSGRSADMATVKALLSLGNMPDHRDTGLPYVVAEIQDPRMVPVARRAYRGPLEVISGNSLISRLLAQNMRHSGLSRVYSELLSHQVGCNIYVRDWPALSGSTLAETQAHFHEAVVCGVVRWVEGEYVPHLNPPPGLVLEPGDRLVFIATGYPNTVPRSPAGQSDGLRAEPVPVAPAAPAPPPHSGSRRILVLGWNTRVAALVHELDTYPDEQFDMTIVSMISARTRQEILAEQGPPEKVVCRHIEADHAVEGELRALDSHIFDNILLASSERQASGEEADARAVVTYLLLEQILEGRSKAPQLILELQDPGNETLLGRRRAEVIISPLILAHMVAQVALRRELRAVFDELFTAGGPELTYRPASSYGLMDEPQRFLDLQSALRSQGETLIGVYHASRDALELNPPAHASLLLEDGDQLVVMTTYA